jgi:hypothetical protein
MLSDIIKAYLSLDVTSVSACSVWLRNQDIWATSSAVPEYAYKSLKDIWVGTTAASSELANRIVCRFGEGLTAGVGEISLYVSPIESAHSELPIQSNTAGAETSFLDIVFRQPPDQGKVKRNENAELRVRYLLDKLWRSTRRTYPYLSASGDTSIVDDVILIWDRYMGCITAEEVASRYIAAYYRAVPK